MLSVDLGSAIVDEHLAVGVRLMESVMMTERADEVSELPNVAALVDDGALAPLDDSVSGTIPLAFNECHSYGEKLRSAREVSGSDESVQTFRGSIGGNKAILVSFDFSFLGGTLGVVAGERIFQAFVLAAEEGVPVISWIRTGGARMQEGALGFMQMARVLSGLYRHRKAGQLSISYLDDPTTGGVFASFGGLADIVIARPGALIGFGGPRVAEACTGRRLDPSSQSAQTLFANRLVDGLCQPDDLRELIISKLRERKNLFAGETTRKVTRHVSSASTGAHEVRRSIEALRLNNGSSNRTIASSWEAVELSRRADRINIESLAFAFDSDAVPIFTGRKSSVAAYKLSLAGKPILLAGYRPEPELRVEAQEIALLRETAKSYSAICSGIVFVVDTYGAVLSEEGEREGVAREIGRSILSGFSLPVPTVTLLSGQGSGGASMALMGADVVLATEDAWLAPLPPEAAAAVIDRRERNFKKVANFQKIDTFSLQDEGVVDVVLPVRMSQSLPEVSAILIKALASALEVAKGSDMTLRHLRLSDMNERALRASSLV